MKILLRHKLRPEFTLMVNIQLSRKELDIVNGDTHEFTIEFDKEDQFAHALVEYERSQQRYLWSSIGSPLHHLSSPPQTCRANKFTGKSSKTSVEYNINEIVVRWIGWHNTIHNQVL